MKCRKNIFTKMSALALAFTMALIGLSQCAVVLAGPAVVTTVIGENSAPTAEKIEISTFKNVQITGEFRAFDPEGETLTFELRGEPKKGVVTIFDDGTFAYCPCENKKGKDSFSYVAIDSSGNCSAEAEVSIQIEKQSTKITYADMDGDPAYYDALRLAEAGSFIGEQINGKYYFFPESTVTRGEFLAMCLNTCGVETPDGISETGFYDDDDISQWLKPYVAAAIMNNTVSGYIDENNNPVFGPSEPISYAEAAVIVNNVLEIPNVKAISEEESVCPAWACQASSNLLSCGVISGTGAAPYSSLVTRGGAAEILAGALTLVEERDGSSSLLFSWLS